VMHNISDIVEPDMYGIVDSRYRGSLYQWKGGGKCLVTKVSKLWPSW
jgi:hypothetical protein